MAFIPVNAEEEPDERQVVLCSNCFQDVGLAFNARKFDQSSAPLSDEDRCPRCHTHGGRKLSRQMACIVADSFFVWGSFERAMFGGSPKLKLREGSLREISGSPALEGDMDTISSVLGLEPFYYGPRYWMIGETDPLRDLQNPIKRATLIERIIESYPRKSIDLDAEFFRVRKNPEFCEDPQQYDSPPAQFCGMGRLDSTDLPILYASANREICFHECRVTAEDNLFVANLSANRPLNLLDLSVLLEEDPEVWEFDSLDIAVHMLFLASNHSYEISRAIAKEAHAQGLDGIQYPSYFSMLTSPHRVFQSKY